MKCSLMKTCCGLLPFGLVVLMAGDGIADVKVTPEFSRDGSFFRFDNVPLPAIDDAGSKGKWKVIDGQGDANSG